MSEVETHYGHSSASGRPPSDGGTVASAKAALGSAAQTARDTLGDAVHAAREGADTVRRTAGDVYARTSHWAEDTADQAARNAVYARRRASVHLGRGRSNIERLVDDNPVMVGVVGLAAGLLVGALLPGTRRENQAFGRYADELKDQGYRYARDFAEQGRHFVEENIQAAGQAVREDGSPRKG